MHRRLKKVLIALPKRELVEVAIGYKGETDEARKVRAVRVSS